MECLKYWKGLIICFVISIIGFTAFMMLLCVAMKYSWEQNPHWINRAQEHCSRRFANDPLRETVCECEHGIYPPFSAQEDCEKSNKKLEEIEEDETEDKEST